MYTFCVDNVKLVRNSTDRPVTAEALWHSKFERQVYDRRAHRFKAESSGATLLGCSPGMLLQSTAAPNPLVGAVGLAYNYHHPLSLSPSAIWLAISQGFSTWINENAETVRSQFVAHEGKALIKLEVPYDPDWTYVLDQFSERIGDYIGKKRDLFLSDFSTASLHERTASEVVLMYSMSSYLEYGMQTMCGFPRITLEGSVEDWERIRDRIGVLAEIGTKANDDHMKAWIPRLLFNLNAFVEAAKGNPDLAFWRKLYHETGGSGGPYISGHIINFFPYLKSTKGKPYRNPFIAGSEETGMRRVRIHPSSFDDGISKVEVEWDRNGDERKVEFHGGFVGVSIADDSTLRPECGWGILDMTNFKDPDSDR